MPDSSSAATAAENIDLVRLNIATAPLRRQISRCDSVRLDGARPRFACSAMSIRLVRRRRLGGRCAGPGPSRTGFRNRLGDLGRLLFCMIRRGGRCHRSAGHEQGGNGRDGDQPRSLEHGEASLAPIPFHNFAGRSRLDDPIRCSRGFPPAFWGPARGFLAMGQANPFLCKTTPCKVGFHPPPHAQYGTIAPPARGEGKNSYSALMLASLMIRAYFVISSPMYLAK
jgi:hypothetical protein